MKSRKGNNKYASRGKVTAYNAVGSPAMAAAKKTTSDGFKKGGKVKALKPGGTVSGAPAAPRLDKRARGGRMSSGRSPYSSGKIQTDRPAKAATDHS